MIENIQSER